MTDSKMEMVLMALYGAIENAAPSNVNVQRNCAIPERIPPAGMIIVRDGVPGEAEVLMSPNHYYYEHQAEIEIIIDRPAKLRESAFDALKQTVGIAISTDRTLGGLCDYVVGEAPSPLMLPVDGAAGFKAATINVVLIYGTDDPLS